MTKLSIWKRQSKACYREKNILQRQVWSRVREVPQNHHDLQNDMNVSRQRQQTLTYHTLSFRTLNINSMQEAPRDEFSCACIACEVFLHIYAAVSGHSLMNVDENKDHSPVCVCVCVRERGGGETESQSYAAQ